MSCIAGTEMQVTANLLVTGISDTFSVMEQKDQMILPAKKNFTKVSLKTKFLFLYSFPLLQMSVLSL